MTTPQLDELGPTYQRMRLAEAHISLEALLNTLHNQHAPSYRIQMVQQAIGRLNTFTPIDLCLHIDHHPDWTCQS